MKTRTKWALRGLVGVVLVASLVPASGTAARADQTRCSYGDARALFQAFVPFFAHQPRETLYPECQYRAFFDGDHVTFFEGDWFVAGSVFFFDYRNVGVSREAAIADLERFTSRLWLSEIGPGGAPGAALEQSLSRTAYKDLDTVAFGLIVYRHDGVLLHLTRGDYLSRWELSYEGEVIQQAYMTVHVLPRPSS